MNVPKIAGRWGLLLGVLLGGWLWGGCSSMPQGPARGDQPGQMSSTNPPAASATASARSGATSDNIEPGSTLVITFSDMPPPKLDPFICAVRQDGTITLQYSKQFQAAGKTTGDLEREIRKVYVPAYYQNLTVSVKAQDQFYFVGGEVKLSNRYQYVSAMTVLKAIQSAGDFTEFARKSRVQVTRADGRVLTVDCYKALHGHPALDLPIYPGDNIHVFRRSAPWQK